MDLFCNEFILKIKSRDNHLMNIHDLIKKVAAILPYEPLWNICVTNEHFPILSSFKTYHRVYN
jgi:hypothetical protein